MEHEIIYLMRGTLGFTNASQIHLRYNNIQHINYYLVFSWVFSVGDGMRGAFFFFFFFLERGGDVKGFD